MTEALRYADSGGQGSRWVSESAGMLRIPLGFTALMRMSLPPPTPPSKSPHHHHPLFSPPFPPLPLALARSLCEPMSMASFLMFMLAAMNVHPVDEGGWGGVWAASVRTRANVHTHTYIRTHSNKTPPPPHPASTHVRTHATRIVCARAAGPSREAVRLRGTSTASLPSGVPSTSSAVSLFKVLSPPPTLPGPPPHTISV